MSSVLRAIPIIDVFIPSEKAKPPQINIPP
jgi:hypothetical protein